MFSGQEITPSEKKVISPSSDTKQPPQGSAEEGPIDPKDVAEYSAEILTELREMASAAGLTFLAYLIQVAVEEAKIQAAELHDGH
ncbi:MAG: hypothetical protein HC850_14255 [Rhodomicrobium sp.]|nr:hypothetical protein [Rhodomicrobium sp.]